MIFLAVYDFHGGVEHLAILHKFGEASVDVSELVVDVVELGVDILEEVIEEPTDLRSVSHGNDE